MKSLVLAEKPSVGRDIARVLHCAKGGNGFLEGNDYVVTWALGHLVTLADPENYDAKYQKWDMETLPMLPDEMKLVVIPQTAKQYSKVKEQLFRKDINEVIIATDAGREGELVARWILVKSGCRKPIKRLWISSVTDKAIREGFANLKNGHDYDCLYHAAVSRAEADWLVGMNGTRALTCKHNAQLSCGRVQTPTLAIIRKREEEIRSFIPKEYATIQAKANGITFSYIDEKNSARIFSPEKADAIVTGITGKGLTVKKVTKKESKVPAPGLYDLTTLQREANTRYGFSAKETLNIMQRLYENYKILTYPRTDSRYISKDVVPTLKERLKACAVGPYRKAAGALLSKPLPTGKHFVDDAKVSDHHAIIPTEEFVPLEKLSNEEKKIYDLVVRRFISVFYPACVFEKAEILAEAGGYTFTAKGKTMISSGWKEVYSQSDEEEEEGDIRDQSLPSVQNGDRYKIESVTKKSGKTTPPARFTESTLLAAMENPVRYMEEKNGELAKTLGETGGLGTVATRADIIEKLFKSFMMEKKGQEIYLTSKARQVLDLVPEDLRKPELTASWEKKLQRISEGKLHSDVFLKEIRCYTEQIVDEIRTGSVSYKHDNITAKKCPTCGKFLLSVNGKNAKMLVCQDRECGYRETVSRVSNARCPNCHKKMELVKSQAEDTFRCACGYKEKLSAFKNRREKEGAGVKKRDVQQYMRKMQKEEQQDSFNPFAQALAGITLDET